MQPAERPWSFSHSADRVAPTPKLSAQPRLARLTSARTRTPDLAGMLVSTAAVREGGDPGWRARLPPSWPPAAKPGSAGASPSTNQPPRITSEEAAIIKDRPVAGEGERQSRHYR